MTSLLAPKTSQKLIRPRFVRTVDALRPHIEKAIHQATTWPFTFQETAARVAQYLAGIVAGAICTLIALGHLP